MPSKNSLSYIKTAEAVAADNNKKQQQQSLQTDFRKIERSNNDIENNNIEELKRKIDTITRYQKPYISKMVVLS